MRLLSAGFAALAATAIVAGAPTQKAIADGGAAIVVGAYFVGDYVVGRRCHMHRWPFNIGTKVAYGLHGRRVCKYHRRHH